MGVTTLDLTNYSFIDDGSIFSQVEVYGYQFQSYANQIIYSFGNGLNELVPTSVWSYTNFTAEESCYCKYETQGCTCGEIEGGSSVYAGYDYYQKLIVDFYNQGNYSITIMSRFLASIMIIYFLNYLIP